MRSRVFFKLLGAFVLVVVTAMVTLDLTVRSEWESSLRGEIARSLTEKAQLFAKLAEHETAPGMEALAQRVSRLAAARATVIDRYGTVLGDSEAAPERMENHSQRPEFAAALRGEVGVSTRWSHTVKTDFLYVAVPFNNGAVRLAYPLVAVEQGARKVRLHLLYATAVALLLAIVVAALLSNLIARRLRRITDFAGRIASGNLGARIAERSSDEIGQVANALDRTAQQLQTSFDEIQRLENARRDFVANVSHELRTPLTSVQGYSETLLDSESDTTRRDFLETIRRNAARMSRLTDDLLTLARVESGERHFDFRATSARVLLEDARQSFLPRAEALRVDLAITDVAPRSVWADGDAIHQVFSNLVDNAMKYGAGGGRIELGARESEGAVEFYVRDFGEGIAPEHRDRLFERFYRVDKARSRESGGTGLGLAIVKHIIRAHGGSIRLESELRRGSTFYFVLPLAPAAVPLVAN